MMKKRGAGILLHISSLPSRFGIGDLGPWAYRFADFLADSGISWWQVLPLNPTHTLNGNCPYSSNSAFAGNSLFISPELLVRDGLLESTYLDPLPEFPKHRVNYEKVTTYHEILLFRAFEFFKKNKKRDEYEKFCAEHSFWLDDFALFTSLRDHLGGRPWGDWPVECRDRDPGTLRAYREKLAEQIENEKFLQYLFHRQWFALKNYCNQKGVRILGDTPIYVDYDSAEVWSHQEFFSLDEHKKPALVSGVPPDYFSATGQLWGNPVYRWDKLKETGYDWWLKRIEHNRRLFDVLRIDHFRGFVSFWEIAAGEKTAINGRWVPGPGEDLFKEMFKHFPDLSLIAEDLGIITQEVRDFITRLGFPGMKVLLFAFTEDMDTNPYAPHNHIANCVLYTGTHDNNTTRGWFDNEAGPAERQRFFKCLGREVGADEVSRELIRIAMSSVANTVFIPMQDFLGLGQEARMNKPATPKGNWEWRLKPEDITPGLSAKIREMVEIYARLNKPFPGDKKTGDGSRTV